MYPSFPQGGGLIRPLWFSTFDPTYMQDMQNVICSGGEAIYSPNNADPPTLWNPRYAMTSNAGNHGVTSPILWGQIVGPKRAMLVTYAGGITPF